MCFLLLAAGLPGAAVRAQEPKPRTVASVDITGLVQTRPALVRDLIRVTRGSALNEAELDRAMSRILKTGRFLSARYTLKDEADGVHVTVVVRERTIVSEIRFEGNKKYSDSRLRSEVLQKAGEAVDWLAVRDGRTAITALYHDAGYGDATVSYDQDLLTRTGVLVYTIEDGMRVRVRKILFEGNNTLPRRDLMRKLETKKAFWFIESGAFDEERTEADVARLRAYHRDEGFLDAQVAYRRELDENGHDLTVVFTIDEGTRYKVESIEFRGNTAFSAAELLGIVGSKVGDVVKRPQIDADVKSIQTRYGELGYIYVRSRANRVFSESPGLVRVTFEIAEGESFRVGRIVVRGNSRTRDKVVRRALNLYPPGDLFDLTETKEAERRLMETRIFGSAKVYPVGDQPGVRDVVIDVREADKAGDFLFGAGVTSNAGLVGNIVLDLQNFDITDRPRSWSELYKLRSFFGGGQRLRLDLQPGIRLARYRVDFTEPYFLDKMLRFDASGFAFRRRRDGYTERRTGATFSLSKRIQHGRLRGWTGELALRLEQASVRDVNLFSARTIREDKGSTFISSQKISIVRDRTDNRFVPTSGNRVTLAYEQFGLLGDEHLFGRATARYRTYRTLRTDLRNRKHVLTLRGELGLILGDAPIFERYFAGGTGSIRGFRFRGIGEREGLQNNNIGGDFRLLAGTEYSFPLVGEKFRGLVFLDSAAVGSGGLRASIGAGVRFTIELFGNVLPLEVDLALPFLTESEDETQVFSFLVGRIF